MEKRKRRALLTKAKSNDIKSVQKSSADPLSESGLLTLKARKQLLSHGRKSLFSRLRSIVKR